MCDDAQLANLVGRIARGDHDALGELYDLTAPLVLAQAQRILRDRPTAEEVTLDTFYKVWRDAGRYDVGRGNARVWLFTIARSKAVDRWRARRRDAAALDPFDLDGGAGPTAGTPEAEESRAIIHEALACLPPEERRAVESAFLEGRSHPEVAEALAIPLGTAKSRIRAGLRRLRRHLSTPPAPRLTRAS